MIVPTLRFSCPVDGCEWYVDETPEEAARELQRDGNALFVPSSTLDGTELTLARHAASHSSVEYLRTIARQREEIARLKL